MATKKTQKTKATKKVEKAVKETTSKIKTAVKSVAKEAEKVVSKVATKTATAKTAAKAAVKTAAKKTTAAAKTAVKAATKPATKAPAKSAAKSAPKASEQTDVKVKADARKVAKKVASVKAAAKPVTKTASMAQTFDPEYLVLMQKDPNWMQAFWEVSEDRIKRAKKGKGKLVLRLFDISGDLTVKRSKKRKFHDVVVPADARSWYVENKATDNTVAVLGFAEGKNFMPLVESVPVQSYSPEGSSVNVDDVFVKASLGGATLGGFGSSGLSSMSAKTWLEQMANGLSSSSGSMFSGALSSAALKSNKLELPKDSVNYGKDFFLWVKTRLIVYGGTRPDAHLQVRGEPFPLNPDGTFSFEEDLPDSTKIIPVFATDKDGDFPTTIVPIVVKRTE
ncbi:DUF4912 domain-containing protein [Fibrobacter sp. UWR2]|uniref:DUF4912 domain-containing protein n=1 Tax=Fibrobacter sp. UWR2 TaxID=1964352 RepID=UPI000B5200DE|nr:DUF4912 domain-containing protein [Fibrobacter sp. UWR2]OWV02090.1 DUF4912 domain-containing protein [Fibrobacter sp. UWR2]